MFVGDIQSFRSVCVMVGSPSLCEVCAEIVRVYEFLCFGKFAESSATVRFDCLEVYDLHCNLEHLQSKADYEFSLF